MDPLTAALNLANSIAQIYIMTLQAMPEDKRAELAAGYADDMKQWRDFLQQFTRKQHATKPESIE